MKYQETIKTTLVTCYISTATKLQNHWSIPSSSTRTIPTKVILWHESRILFFFLKGRNWCLVLLLNEIPLFALIFPQIFQKAQWKWQLERASSLVILQAIASSQFILIKVCTTVKFQKDCQSTQRCHVYTEVYIQAWSSPTTSRMAGSYFGC